MNTTQPISSAELADHLAMIQPPAIARRLLNDPKFRADFGSPIKRAISYSGGPAISTPTLHDCIRKLLVDRQPRSVFAINRQEIHARLGDGYILISFTAEDGTTIEVGSFVLMLLSPARETRQSALDRLLGELGPTGPSDPAYWRQQLDKGPLDDEGMEQITNEFEDSPVPHLGRIERDIATGVLDKRNLVPTSVQYWECLCGPRPDTMEQETWLQQVFEPHRRRLIDRELARGLDLCLAMSIRHDLTPRALLEQVSNDDLWTALQQTQPIDDPFSLVAVVDIAASRAQADQRFEQLAVQTVERLTGETLRRNDGLDIYGFLPALIDLAVGELQVMPTIASQPAYWRRICAWTQAALLVRTFRIVTFDAQVFCDHVNILHSPEARIAALLDLQETPLWHPSESSRLSVRAEVVGRLILLREREEAEGRKLPGLAALNKAAQDLAECAPLLAHMPGPLEINRLPALRMEQHSVEQKTELWKRADALTADFEDDNWVRFFHLSRLVQFDEHILSRITALVPAVNFGTTEEAFESNMALMTGIAFTAVAQRHLPLGEAVLARCRHEIEKCLDEAHAHALIKIGLIAAAASADKAVALENLAKYLVDLGYLLPQGAPCRELCAAMESLKTLIPVSEWYRFSRAEALGALGS